MRTRGFRNLFMVVALNLISNFALGEDGHDLSTIKGTHEIDLKAYDHAMAGSIKSFVLWGSVNESSGTSELIMRRDGQDVKASFKRDGNSFGGIVQHEIDGALKKTSIQFSSLDRQNNEFRFSVNGSPVLAKVSAEAFRNNHFIKPTYTIVLPSGDTASFKFEGQACFNYSLHLLTMMIAALSH